MFTPSSRQLGSFSPFSTYLALPDNIDPIFIEYPPGTRGYKSNQDKVPDLKEIIRKQKWQTINP